MDYKFTETEKSALYFLASQGGSVLISEIPDTNQKDIFGCVTAGIRVYQKLENKGFLIITEEEPDETGFEWTPMVELTDEGREAASTQR